ncbi:MAG TPA: hypothetical protein VMA13_09615 [Candidatus Saccharimonadales bacterium]|nr:hypothetical protein [Candidatus Saccharimonadales bacterium]
MKQNRQNAPKGPPFYTIRFWIFCVVTLLVMMSRPLILTAQTYAPPTNGDYGGLGPFNVFVDTFTNPAYPSANGTNLIVSVFHPNMTINPSLPTIFLLMVTLILPATLRTTAVC